MKDINKIMPKLHGMRWAAITNQFPTNQKIRELDRLLPHDKRWHTVFESDHSVIVDDVPIVKKSKESMT